MKKIELNKREYEYLDQASFLPDKIYNLSSMEKIQEELYLLQISEEQTDVLRDIFGERLQLFGFDENYELTPEGEVLESLIDKFFIG